MGTATNNYPSPVTMNASVKANLVDGAPTPVTVLFANYNNVKSNAFTSNLLKVVNNQVQDVPGRTSSPYQAQTLFAACPAVNATNTGDASFIFKPNVYFTNSTVSVSSFYVDFADGAGYRAVGWNTSITANYLSIGTKQIKIKMTLSNGSSYECYSSYYVANPSHATSRYNDVSYDFFHAFPARTGIDAGGTAFIEYSSVDRAAGGKITKPLIVIEGYDIASAAPDLQKDRTTYADFMTAIKNAQLGGYDFNGQLDDVGHYDIIFIQFNNGTDDIKKNAAFIEEVIQWVNAQKAAAGSVQQNVVMGESMGGLIARYALADMTKNYPATPTQTRLLITHDSPHHGANFPLGLQHIIQMAGHAHLFGYDVKDVFANYDEVINLLGQTGTQQLLLYRSTGETTSVANTFLDGEYRTMVTFSGSVQPTYQFVATSLGSECANPLYPAYQKVLDVDVDAFLFLAPLISYRFHTQVEDYALPATGSTSKIAKLLLSSKFKLFGLITVAKQVYNNTAYAPGYQIPVDGAPGSKYDFSNFDVPGATSVPSFNIFVPIPRIFGIIGYLYAYSSGGSPTNFAFVPVGSALDVSPYNSSTLSQKFVAGTNPAYPSTSATYIAQETYSPPGGGTSYNNYHLAFTARNAHWLFDRMQGVADNLNCSSVCQPNYTITGASIMCGSSSNYSISGVALGSTVTWSVSPSGYAIPSPTTGSSTTLTKQANGNITLTATISPCNQTITLPVSVGAPTVNASGSPNGSCFGSTQTWSLTASPASGSNWNWTVDYLGSNSSIYIRNPNSASTYADVTGGGTVKLSYTDVYGVAQTVGGPTVYSNCHGKPIHHYITPNPASNLITISTDKENSKTNNLQDLMYAIKITDRFGILRKLVTYKPGVSSTTIAVADLNAGTYLVSIFDGKEWSSEKLIVQK